MNTLSLRAFLYVTFLCCTFLSCSNASNDDQLKLEALYEKSLSDPQDTVAFESIWQLSHSKDEGIRGNALAYLGLLAQEHPSYRDATVRRMIAVLQHGDKWDKRVAAEKMVDLAGPDTTVAIPSLIACLSDPKADYAWFAAEALGNYGRAADSAVDELEAALSTSCGDKDNQMAEFAMRSLGKIGNPTSVKAIQGCLGRGSVDLDR